MTTITAGLKCCERDTGFLVRDCECPDCSLIREEFVQLHIAKASVYTSNRSEREKEIKMLAIERQIERYKQWL